MWKAREIDKPAGFNFALTVQSHGWYDLPPFKLDENAMRLGYVFHDRKTDKKVYGEISEASDKIKIELEAAISERSTILEDVSRILRLSDDVQDFHDSISGHENFNWVGEKGAGRLLRSPTVWEDLVKTMCTTNCSWALTKNMVSNLVEKLGDRTKSGKAAFPTAQALAAKKESFYRDKIRAGYRSPYFVEMAEAVASGKLDPESWLHTDIPTPELKLQIKSIKGIGDYAAENLLKLLDRYDGLALDSWLRGQFYKKHNRGKVCPDKKIEKKYSKFGKWKGLAIWCDMTEDWHKPAD